MNYKVAKFFIVLNALKPMAVYDHNGRMYLPVLGYDWEISHYAIAREAIDIAIKTWFE